MAAPIPGTKKTPVMLQRSVFRVAVLVWGKPEGFVDLPRDSSPSLMDKMKELARVKILEEDPEVKGRYHRGSTGRAFSVRPNGETKDTFTSEVNGVVRTFRYGVVYDLMKMEEETFEPEPELLEERAALAATASALSKGESLPPQRAVSLPPYLCPALFIMIRGFSEKPKDGVVTISEGSCSQMNDDISRRMFLNALPQLVERRLIARVEGKKGFYIQGPQTRFFCSAPRLDPGYIAPLPKSRNDIRLCAGQEYCILELMEQYFTSLPPGMSAPNQPQDPPTVDVKPVGTPKPAVEVPPITAPQQPGACRCASDDAAQRLHMRVTSLRLIVVGLVHELTALEAELTEHLLARK